MRQPISSSNPSARGTPADWPEGAAFSTASLATTALRVRTATRPAAVCDQTRQPENAGLKRRNDRLDRGGPGDDERKKERGGRKRQGDPCAGQERPSAAEAASHL